MKRLFVLVLILVAAGFVAAQQVDIETIDPSQIDFRQVDVSGIEFYLQGPVQLYVTGVRYGNTVYSAILDYDGGQTVDIRAPRVVTTVGKPNALDLSEVTVSLEANGIRLGNVIANGRYYSGIFQVTRNNDLAVSAVYYGDQVPDPATQVRTLQGKISGLERTIGRQRDQIARLQDQVEELPEAERVTQLRNQVQDLEGKLSRSQAEVTRIESRLNASESEVDELESEVSSLERELRSSESRGSRLENTLSQRDSRIAELQQQVRNLPTDSRVDRLESEVSELERDIANRDRQISMLQDRLEDLRTMPWDTAMQRMTRVLKSGFSGGSVGMGTWETSNVAVTQNDSSALFAKYIVSVQQGTGELYYRFSGRALGNGRQGFGIHLLAGGSKTPRGYGYGNSYLVWVTKDQGTYQTPGTYVQLYRSFDDTHMIQLQSSAVDSSISGANTIEVHISQARDRITVLVDGELTLSYQVPGSPLTRGTEVVARTMGNAVIRDLQVRTTR